MKVTCHRVLGLGEPDQVDVPMRRREMRPLYRQRLEANAVRGRPSLLAVIARLCPPGVPGGAGNPSASPRPPPCQSPFGQ
jgi:hypothetical protein